MKWIGVALLTFVCSLAALIAQSLFRFDLQLSNSVIAKIYARLDQTGGSLVDLTPDVFGQGMSENMVNDILAGDGFV